MIERYSKEEKDKMAADRHKKMIAKQKSHTESIYAEIKKNKAQYVKTNKDE